MKVAFVGKGGSGKTSLATLFCRDAAAAGFPVLAIDADINQHFAESLGVSQEHARSIPALGLGISHVKEFLRGTNPRIPDARLMIKTTPPGRGSSLIHFGTPHPLLDAFAYTHESIKIMVAGPMAEEDLGVRCYHGKVGAVELILNHLVDTEQQYVVVDMTAGADAFASGLFSRFDATFVVVEPTMKSVDVWKQYAPRARAEGARVFAVGNQIASADDLTWLTEAIGETPVASIGVSPFIRAQERGSIQPFETLEPETRDAIHAIRATVDACPKDWDQYRQDSIVFHTLNATSWANASLSTDLITQIDPEFRYPT